MFEILKRWAEIALKRNPNPNVLRSTLVEFLNTVTADTLDATELLTALDNRDPKVRYGAAVALTLKVDSKCLDKLMSTIGTEGDSHVRNQLQEAITTAEQSGRRFAADGFTVLGAACAHLGNALQQVLSAENRYESICQALRCFADLEIMWNTCSTLPVGVEELVRATLHEGVKVLYQSGSVRYVAMALTDHPDWMVRYAAAVLPRFARDTVALTTLIAAVSAERDIRVLAGLVRSIERLAGRPGPVEGLNTGGISE